MGVTWVYTYDDAGNTLSKTEYAYTTGTLGSATGGNSYDYGDSSWGDLMTVRNSATFVYDDVGNLVDDKGFVYTWEHGRQLSSITGAGITWTFTYDSNGMRTSRTDGTTTYNYVYNGSSLSQMTVDGHTLRFTYDASGKPLSVTYDGTEYYYALNLQGDVVAILDGSGSTVVEYIYDAWGNFMTPTGSLKDTLGFYNPLLYRGYVFDPWYGMYYLQSRYYIPRDCRFLNADALVSTGQGILGNNMFAYCNNNPVNLVDRSGGKPEEAIDTDGDGENDCYVYTYTYTVGILFWQSTKTGRVYIYTNVLSEADFQALTLPEGFNEGTDLLIGDWTNSSNPTMYAYQAQKVKSTHRSDIVDIMFEYTSDFDKQWERTKGSVMTEWKEHHRYARFSARAQNIDFDEEEEGKGGMYYFWKAVDAVLN